MQAINKMAKKEELSKVYKNPKASKTDKNDQPRESSCKKKDKTKRGFPHAQFQKGQFKGHQQLCGYARK